MKRCRIVPMDETKDQRHSRQNTYGIDWGNRTSNIETPIPNNGSDSDGNDTGMILKHLHLQTAER